MLDGYGVVFSGSLDTTAGYDAISPGVAAIQAFRNRPEGKGLAYHRIAKMAAIVIAGSSKSKDNFVEPLYRDRNALLDLDMALQSRKGKFQPTPVYIIYVDNRGDPQRVGVTDTSEWLPYAFTDKSLGLDKVPEQKFQRLVTYS